MPAPNGRNGHQWTLRARLFGGAGDGRLIDLESLIPAIAVYLTDTGTVVCDRNLPGVRQGRFVGYYDLVAGAGPEPPMYVAGA